MSQPRLSSPIRVLVLYGVPMTTPPDEAATAPSSARQRHLVVLLVALAAAVVLTRIVSSAVRGGAVPAPLLQVVVADLAVWVPLAAGVAWVLHRSRRATAATLPSLRIDLGDTVFALGIVIVCRTFDAFLGLALTGTTGLVPAPTLGTPDVGLLVVSAIGVVLVSPVLEEVFFRGVLQRDLAAELTPRTRWLAVVLTAFLFALAHVLLGAPATTIGGFQVFVTTFALGLLTGTLVAMTDRIGGAILAHVLFNAVAVVATWPR